MILEPQTLHFLSRIHTYILNTYILKYRGLSYKMPIDCMYSRQKRHHTMLLFAGCERCTEKGIKVVELEACDN